MKPSIHDPFTGSCCQYREVQHGTSFHCLVSIKGRLHFVEGLHNRRTEEKSEMCFRPDDVMSLNTVFCISEIVSLQYCNISSRTGLAPKSCPRLPSKWRCRYFNKYHSVSMFPENSRSVHSWRLSSQFLSHSTSTVVMSEFLLLAFSSRLLILYASSHGQVHWYIAHDLTMVRYGLIVRWADVWAACPDSSPHMGG